MLEWWASENDDRLGVRARILIACAAGGTNAKVANSLGVAPQTVCTWRARFLTSRLAGLFDRPRPGAPRRARDAKAAEVLACILGESEADRRPRSGRMVASHVGLSQSTTRRILREAAAVGASSMGRAGPRLVGLYVFGRLTALALAGDGPAAERRTDVTRFGPSNASRRKGRSFVQRLITALQMVAAQAAVPEARQEAGFAAFLDALDEVVPRQLTVRVVTDDPSGRVVSRHVGTDGGRFALTTAGTRSWADLASSLVTTTGECVRDVVGAVLACVAQGMLAQEPFVWIRADRDHLVQSITSRSGGGGDASAPQGDKGRSEL